MRILVIGATGFIGGPVFDAARAAGHTVIGVARTQHPALEAADRRRPDEITSLVRFHRIDVVIDIVAYTKPDTLPLLDALDGSIERYVMLSSADVYASYELLNRKREGEPNATLAEDAPLRVTRFPYRGDTPRAEDADDAWMDDYDKIPIEDAVRRMKSAWTILRLPMVYGPGDRQTRFAWASHAMTEGAAELVIPPAWAHWVSTFEYVHNVAEAIVFAATHASAANRIFNVGEAEPVEQIEWAHRLARALAWQGEIRIDADAPMARRLGALDLTVPLALDTSALSALGFEPSTSVEAALAATLVAFGADQPARTSSA